MIKPNRQQTAPTENAERRVLLQKSDGDGRELIGAIGIKENVVAVYHAHAEIIEKSTEDDHISARAKFDQTVDEATQNGWKITDIGSISNFG